MIIRRNSSSLRIVTALINIFAIAACNPDAMPGPVVSKGQILISTGQRSIHRPSTPSQVLASRIPEFGGAFIDERGILKVYLTNSSATLAARLLIQDQLRAQRRPQLRFQFIPGTYSYARLESFIEVLLPFLGPSGTAYVWIDERRNRLRIGVATQIARARLTGAITQLNIPLGAIIIEDAKYPVALSQRNLNDQVRPLLGGLEVGVIGRPGTLAAIVKLQGQTYALVSSHVADPTGNGGIGYETKQNAFTTRIGTVAVNPAFTSSPNGCPTGGRCRYSDAALVLLDTGASYSFSSIAAPIGGPSYTGEGPRDFDTAAPMQLASDPVSCPNNSPCTIDWYPGDSATKVGKTTGWTGGKYIGMATYIQAVDGLYRLENILVEGLALGGDSGAPIVSKARDKISGILWGGDIVIDGKNAFIGSYLGQHQHGAGRYSVQPTHS